MPECLFLGPLPFWIYTNRLALIKRIIVINGASCTLPTIPKRKQINIACIDSSLEAESVGFRRLDFYPWTSKLLPKFLVFRKLLRYAIDNFPQNLTNKPWINPELKTLIQRYQQVVFGKPKLFSKAWNKALSISFSWPFGLLC